MCSSSPPVRRNVLATAWPAEPSPTPELPRPAGSGTPATGSLRARLWDLPDGAHCPIVGLCLPLAEIRRLARKAWAELPPEDHVLHSWVVGQCRERTPLAQTVQRALDARHALALKAASACKTADALGAWWHQALQGHEPGAALWATLTHARCDTELAQRVLGEVHMLQHQRGAARCADLAALSTLRAENAALGRSLAEAQRRCTAVAERQRHRLVLLEARLLRAEAARVASQTAQALAEQRLHELGRQAPDLAPRAELQQANESLRSELRTLRRRLTATEQALQQAQQAVARRGASAREAANAADASPPAAGAEGPASPGAVPASPGSAVLRRPAPQAAAGPGARAVLCVGGRPASVPAYRRLVEDRGARFLHHDGGDEQGIARLDPALAAADLVICQTGCVSHDAYWRVKDHCRRTGKPCVFVDRPSRAALGKALACHVAAAGVAAGAGGATEAGDGAPG